jgi:hypothetical protein
MKTVLQSSHGFDVPAKAQFVELGREIQTRIKVCQPVVLEGYHMSFAERARIET